MKSNEYKYKELTYKVIGCAMTVHSTLGSGFQEVIYQRALSIEFDKNFIKYERELEMKVVYNSFEVGSRRVDFLIDRKVMLEIKAVSELNNIHFAQGLNYLEAYNMEIGLLINFGSLTMQTRRIMNLKHCNPDNP